MSALGVRQQAAALSFCKVSKAAAGRLFQNSGCDNLLMARPERRRLAGKASLKLHPYYLQSNALIEVPIIERPLPARRWLSGPLAGINPGFWDSLQAAALQ